MFENIGWPEILVLVVAGLFILGPERLPEAAAWVGKTIRQVRDYATGARDHLKKEMGPEFDQLQQPLNDLRSLRNLNPRTAITRTLMGEDGPTKPNGYAPGPNGAAANGNGSNGSASNGSGTSGSGTNGSGTNAAATPAAAPQAPLSTGERPPIDPDAT
ncbi:MAG: Sec-independent protein translocase protein TatB [Pseudonocardia sp.]|nr:Sec-independent protein translocase protein TatB [Pseudonocardia sp.]